MATKSKNFKHTVFAKGLCFFLSLLLFFVSAFSVVTISIASSIYGFKNYLDSNYKTYPSCMAFTDRFQAHTEAVVTLASTNTATLREELEAYADDAVNEAVNEYLDEKARIIHDELEYAVNNYDESYFNYEYAADAVEIPDEEELVTASQKANTEHETTTAAIPRNIEAAQKVLKNCEGRDFLNYAVLVRDSAFDADFDCSVAVTIDDSDSATLNFTAFDMKSDESQIRYEFLSQYNDFADAYIDARLSENSQAISSLPSLLNLKYYTVSKDGTVYTNIDGDAPTADAIKAHTIYAYFDGEKTLLSGIDESIREHIGNIVTVDGAKSIIIYLENQDNGKLPYDDIYSQLLQAYHAYQSFSAKTLIVAAVFSLLIAFILLITLLCLCGHVNGKRECVTAYIDKLPNDLHLILSFGGMTAVLVFTGLILDSIAPSDYRWFYYSDYFTPATAASLTLCWAILTEWLSSVVRIKKAGSSWFRHTLIAKLIFGIGRLFGKLKKILTYKPQKFTRNIVLIAAGYVMENLILDIWAAAASYTGLFSIPIILILIYNIVCIIFIAKYINNLDRIITASMTHKAPDFGGEKLPESLRILSENLQNSNEEVERAVAKAVRDEQMKTELITNVSHDLKTPLTSLISYSDLLSKCDIQDETAKRYIGILNEQSIKLKRLIEDLIEASKVSTGNVTLNKSVLNLSELASQAIAEFETDMEKNGNTVIFNEPESAPKVFADGNKTYRIISNLLNNAKKYSAPNTRVYISVYGDEKSGYFEIKNISGEPLNISPEELTERFVRGDKSRSREGNGLGLSIAKDLCTLQDGELKILIDGDLFKAIVQLPAKTKTPWTVPASTEPIEDVNFDIANYVSDADITNE